jgi:WD40 repeat protein
MSYPPRSARWIFGFLAVMLWAAAGSAAAPPVHLATPPPTLDHTITALAVSPDGELIAAVAHHGVQIWSKKGAVENAMQGWGGVAFSGDGKRLVTGRTGGSVALYERLPTGDTLVMLGQHSGAVNCVAFARRAKIIVSGGDDNYVRLWDPDAGRETHALEGHEGLVCAVAVSADGKRVASASLDLTVRLWDGETGKELRCLEDHHDQVRGLAFSPDGKQLFTAGMDGKVCQRDVSSGKAVRRFEGHRGAVRGLSLSDDGMVLATAGEDGTVRVWDVGTGREQRRIDVCSHGVSAVAVFPDGRTVVSADPTGAVIQWHARTGANLRRVQEGEDIKIGGSAVSSHLRTCLAWAPDGRFLATGGADHWVRLWDAATGKLVRPLGRHTDLVWSVAFSPDGKFVASVGRRDGLVHLWEVDTGKPVYRFGRAHRGGISGLAWSVDGKQVVSAGGSFDPALHMWDAASGKLLRRLEGHTNLVDGLALSADGRRAVSAAYDRTLRLWDLTTGRHRELGATQTSMLALAPGGEFAATAGEGTHLTLWDLDGGGVTRIDGHAAITSAVAMSPDGYTLAVGDQEGSVYLWECLTGRLRVKFPTELGSIHCLVFRPDGKALAVDSQAGGTRIHDCRSLFATHSAISLEAFGLLADCQRLRSEDAEEAWRAMLRLAAAKDRAVALLGRAIRPPTPTSADRIEQWIHDLDSDTFTVRERATLQLRRVGRPARAALKHALESSPSPEAKRRIEGILEFSLFASSPDELRTWRALEVLEEIGTPAARAVLQRMAGSSETGPGRVARAALDRLRRRSPPAAP